MTNADAQSYLDRGLALANAPLSIEMVRTWNALEDELLGKLNLDDVNQLRELALTMPHMGAGVILAIIK